MPVLYKPFQSNLEDKKSGKKLFYPHVVRTGNINSAQLSKEIAAYSSLSPGDVKNTLDNLVTVMAQHLQSSESVSVDGLGTFRMVMSARGRGVETADEVRFQPTTTKNLDRTTATRSMVTGAKCARYDKLVSAPGDGGSVDDPNDKPGGGSDGGDDGEAPDPTV